MMAYLELAGGCEQAAGPDRTIDGLIFARINPTKRIIIGSLPGPFPQEPEYGTPLDILDMAKTDGPGLAQYLGAPNYTASIDAALTLVPEGSTWELNSEGAANVLAPIPDEPGWFTDEPVQAATPTLALCAAALKARAASGIEAATAVGTTEIGPTEGESPTPQGDAQRPPQ